jgi:ferrous iron transport protein B
MKLSDLQHGQSGIITKVRGRGAFRRRIIEMGFVKGKRVEMLTKAPLRDPTEYKVMDYEVSLRRSEAELIEIVTGADVAATSDDGAKPLVVEEQLVSLAAEKSKTINVALVGNPNSGKTSLFNVASGTHEKVGNYSGVTVDAKEGRFRYKDYTFNLVDLPGTYSLSTCSPEETYVRNHIATESPDIIINVVSASALERNLYLTAQLIDMDATVVIALNMFDELEKSGARFDYNAMAEMIGCPIVPTVAKTGKGIPELFDAVIETYEGRHPAARHIHINYGEEIETGIEHVKRLLNAETALGHDVSRRYLSILLLEGDAMANSIVSQLNNAKNIFRERDIHAAYIREDFREEVETAFTDARYGFIDGALKQTFREGQKDVLKVTHWIDKIAINKLMGFPVFFLFMFIMFEGTFILGEYPMRWIESGVALFGEFLNGIMEEGQFKDLLINGIVGGVGSVIVFLPNIVILYLFISFMEDTGYMARAAFIMDRFMQKMGLHGKSFIPLVMGFGCNVPAIMSTRIIESRNTRLITMLVNSLMSCSARLPVYLLLVGAFFPHHGAIVLFGLYITGIALAIIMARIFKRFLIRGEDLPFVMELPPYRMPTFKAMCRHGWDKTSQYLKKMGGIILVASVIVWFLNYYPIGKESYIAQIGHFLEPVMRPLGFDWKICASLLSGMTAKEIIVSTMGIIYGGSLDLTPLTALSMMVFVLVYFPCIATLAAIKNESGSWKWAAFTVFYTTALAWVMGAVVYQIGGLLGFR